ncbi:hypothetical protein KUTG_00442 [Kutzneria sp. 744]|nr:hypothetical protein KUTG_00442 [Kutzneria sp. 744]
MTRGILDPGHYYYRRVYTDAIRAVDAARTHPAIGPGRMYVAGGSQGGFEDISPSVDDTPSSGLLPCADQAVHTSNIIEWRPNPLTPFRRRSYSPEPLL